MQSLVEQPYSPTRGLASLAAWHFGDGVARCLDALLRGSGGAIAIWIGIALFGQRGDRAPPTLEYIGQPVSAALLEPLLRTPQGLALLAFCGFYLLSAAAFAWGNVPAPFGARADACVAVCLTWPLALVTTFVAGGVRDGFAPSWWQAAWLAAFALAPVVYAIWWRV